MFAGVGYAMGDFQEGKGNHRWQLLGVERRTRDMTLEAEVSNHSYGYGNKTGARIALARDIDDHWQYGGSLDYLTAATRCGRSRTTSAPTAAAPSCAGAPTKAGSGNCP